RRPGAQRRAADEQRPDAVPRRHPGRRVHRHVHRGHRGRVRHLCRGRLPARPPRRAAGRRPGWPPPPGGRPGMGGGLMATAAGKPRPRDGKPRAGGAGGDGTDSGAARTGLSRAVIWTGIALGTAVALLAISGGARPQIGGPPSWLGAVLGVLLVYALIVLAAVTLAELTRRPHKTARRYATRHGKRGALAAGRAARPPGRTAPARPGA